MNLPEVLAAALRAQAAYLEDAEASRAAFTELGYEWYGLYQNASHQAVLALRDGRAFVSIAGTRFSTGKMEDLEDDLRLDSVGVGGGAAVTAGAYEGLGAMWAWAQGLAPRSSTLEVCGHSLGGWRTYYTPLFVPDCRIAGLYAFESPKSANAKFWELYDRPDTVSVVHEEDLFFGYPFVGFDELLHPPHDHLWLRGGTVEVIRPADWPTGWSPEDHSIDAVVAALRALTPAA